MSDQLLDSSTLPDKCVGDIEVYLRTRKIVVDGKNEATLLGVPCQVHCEGAGRDSSLVILAARPLASAEWNFGKCFPELPGKSGESRFRMKFLTLKRSLWFFVWGRDVTNDGVRSCVVNAPWFQEWAREERQEADANAYFTTLGFDKNELQAVPHATWSKTNAGRDSSTSSSGDKSSTSGFFLWGDLNETNPSAPAGIGELALLSELAGFLGSKPLLLTKAKVECEEDWAHLTLRLPAGGVSLPLSSGGQNSQDGVIGFENVAVQLSSVPYFGPQDTSILGTGDFVFSEDKKIHLDLLYPIEGDVVWAKGTYTGGVTKLLGDGDAFDFPGLSKSFGANQQIELELEFSLSTRELIKLSFGVEVHQQDWKLMEEPILVQLDGVSFHFTIFEPMSSSRSVEAQIVFETTIGVGSNPQDRIELACGGSYPSGQLFFQARNRVPVGRLLNKFLGAGASTELDKFDFDDFRLDYNYKNSNFELRFNVLERWEIVKGFEVGELRFQIRSDKTNKTCQGSLGGTLSLGKVDLKLEATYRDEVWGFNGKAGTIYISELFKDGGIPAAIKSLVFDGLELSFKTGKEKSFRFHGTAKLEVDGQRFDITLTVEAEEKAGRYEKKFAGVIKIGGAQFKFDLTSGEAGEEIVARWSNTDKDSGTLNLGSVSDKLPDLSDLKSLLQPEEATLRLNLNDDKKRVALYCKSKGLQVAFLLTKGPTGWIAALGLIPGRISTDSLGPLGTALKPYSIALDKLLLVAASADAPAKEQLMLGDAGQSFHRGLLLQGTLEFGGTSFSYPFECRLGGDDKAPELTANSGASTQPTGSTTATALSPSGNGAEREEAKNNVEVGRTVGPITFRNARFESRDAADSGKHIYVLLDASLATGGFGLDLIGFNLSFPLSMLQDLKDPINNAAAIVGKITPGLDGLSISYSKPPLVISGGFAKTKADPSQKLWDGDVYRGHLLVKAATFQITVLGAYGTLLIKGEKQSALFFYGALTGMLGGPPEFFVTGLALGGGYNTRLALPAIEKVSEFPLIQAVTNPDEFAVGGTERLMKTVDPSYGDYWIAAGLQFTTYKLADSFALFSVAFGNRLQFALLGLTKLSMPAGALADKCAVSVELAIRAVVDPEAGVFSIEGRLTQNSYVLAKELRLTGGFAFFVWFGNAKQAGDFVISLGGYHPNFIPPQYYPVVPRIGIRGQIGGLSIAGEAYMALTPSCVMAGLKLEAAFKTEIIVATFLAYADFLIAWAPFHYDARIGIGICVVFQPLRSFKFEIAASLHIWGPQFAGTAYVSLWIISFTVSFGDHSKPLPDPLTWNQFQEAFLPAPASRGNRFNTIRITEGLIREVKKMVAGDETLYRIVNPHELMIETDSTVPCSEVKVGNGKSITSATPIGIRPMGATKLESHHVVSITKDGTSVETKFKPVQWKRKSYPEALWSTSAAPRENPPKAAMVEDVPSGVVLRVELQTPQHRLGPFPIEMFMFEQIDKRIRWSEAATPPKSIAKKSMSEKLAQELNGDKPRRDLIRACLVSRWNAGSVTQAKTTRPARWNEFSLTHTSEQPLEYFQAPPTCAALGSAITEDGH